MTQLRTIEIDFDIHKLIEAERQSFEEAPYKALRRLLNLPPSAASKAAQKSPSGRPWTGKGVALPHGTLVRMDYNGRRHAGRIEDGRWLVEGTAYSSPSGAASGVALTKKGTKTKLDGWRAWEIKRPSDSEWIWISTLLSQLSPDDLGL